MNKTMKINIMTVCLSLMMFGTACADDVKIEDRCLDREQVEYKIQTKGSNVNLRKSSNINSKVIAKIPNGSKIVKISDYQNGKWAKTVYTTNKGNEYIGYILYDNEYVKEIAQDNTKRGVIIGNRVVFRSSGSKYANKQGYFYKGNIVEVIDVENKNGYMKVRVVNTNGVYKSAIGYVHKDYVKFI